MKYRRGSTNTIRSYKEMAEEAIGLASNPLNKVMKAVRNSLTFSDVPYKNTEECKNEKDEKIKETKLKDERYDGVVISMDPFNMDIIKAILHHYYEVESLDARLINNKIVIKNKFIVSHKK